MVQTDYLSIYFNASPQKKANILYTALLFMEKNPGTSTQDAIIEGVKGNHPKKTKI